MNIKYLAISLIVGTASFSIDNKAIAAITCNNMNPAQYDCATNALGPLWVGWDWGIGGNFGGGWVDPDGNPYRSWNCGCSGLFGTQISVTVEHSDGTFDIEFKEINCDYEASGGIFEA